MVLRWVRFQENNTMTFTQRKKGKEVSKPQIVSSSPEATKKQREGARTKG